MNIKRNKSIAKHLQKQLKRLGYSDSLTLFFEEHIITELSIQDTLAVMGQAAQEIREDIFNNDAVLIETLKIIGLMEASKDKKEFETLTDKRQKLLKPEQKEITDFDKILKGIMKVPNDKNDNGKE